jgi:hypothetical protein
MSYLQFFYLFKIKKQFVFSVPAGREGNHHGLVGNIKQMSKTITENLDHTENENMQVHMYILKSEVQMSLSLLCMCATW